jgi:hypothetical protein
LWGTIGRVTACDAGTSSKCAIICAAEWSHTIFEYLSRLSKGLSKYKNEDLATGSVDKSKTSVILFVFRIK